MYLNITIQVIHNLRVFIIKTITLKKTINLLYAMYGYIPILIVLVAVANNYNNHEYDFSG